MVETVAGPGRPDIICYLIELQQACDIGTNDGVKMNGLRG